MPHGLTRDPESLPAEPGAYLLAIRLGRARRLAIARLGAPRLAAGLYLYAGSARGPGGIRARVRRHLRRDKRHHWHVDHLVAAGRVVGVWGRPGARECALVRRLLTVRGVEVPAPGFGSSDCRTCAAHLLSLAADVEIDAVLAAPRGAPALAIIPTPIRMTHCMFPQAPGGRIRALGLPRMSSGARLRLPAVDESSSSAAGITARARQPRAAGTG